MQKTKTIVAIVLFISCSTVVQSQTPGKVGIEILVNKGAEDVMNDCRIGATNQLRSEGVEVVSLETNPTVILRIVMDDLFVATQYGNRWVPVAAMSWKVTDSSQFKHPFFSHPLLMTTPSSGYGTGVKMNKACQDGVKALVADKDYWS